MNKRSVFAMALVLAAASLWAQTAVLQSVKGDVKVRRGVAESWISAVQGLELKAVDSILSGEAGHAVLKLDSGQTFEMGPWTILDIGDLRRISERELFLYVMAERVKKLPDTHQNSLRITRVSVARAEDRSSQPSQIKGDDTEQARLEFNGAKALWEQAYVTNAAMKVHRVLQRHHDCKETAEAFFLLGQCYEALEQPGQALESYRSAEKAADEQGKGRVAQAANEAVKRLE